MQRLTSWLFDDSGDHLDRFGLLLILSVLSVTVNSLVPIDDPTSSFGSEVAWIGTTIIVGATLMVAIRSSGVAPRPRRYASIAVGLVVLATVAASVSSAFLDSSSITGQPSVIWVLLAASTPVFVTRRLFLQDRVTAGTIFGAIATFLLVALAFDYMFLTLDQYQGPIFGEWQPTTSFMYFSLVTITTLGYGDLNPMTEVSRYFATAEAVIGTIFLVTVVARLVSLFGTDRAILPDRTVPDSSRGAGSAHGEDAGGT